MPMNSIRLFIDTGNTALYQVMPKAWAIMTFCLFIATQKTGCGLPLQAVVFVKQWAANHLRRYAFGITPPKMDCPMIIFSVVGKTAKEIYGWQLKMVFRNSIPERRSLETLIPMMHYRLKLLFPRL